MVFCSVKTGSSRRIVVDFETGGIAALVLRSMPFSVMSGIGFIATFGVATLDGVVFASPAPAMSGPRVKTPMKQRKRRQRYGFARC